jgi:hypothetical protein
MRNCWHLNIHEKNGIDTPPIATCDFGDFLSLRATVSQHRQRTFLLAPPENATQDDFLRLLDLRSQGFDVRQTSYVR